MSTQYLEFFSWHFTTWWAITMPHCQHELLAGTMPSKKHGKHDKQVTLLRNIAIQRYYQASGFLCRYARKSPISSHRPINQKPCTAILAQWFLLGLAIYSEGAFFTRWANITPIPHNIAKPIFCQSRTDSIMRCDATNPAPFDAIWSGEQWSNDTQSL